MKKILFVTIFSVFAFIACDSKSTQNTEANSTKESNLSREATKIRGTDISIRNIELIDKQDSFEVIHSMGKVLVKKNPKNVVVFDFPALETLEVLGLGDNVAGLATNFLPKYLEKFKDKKNVGSMTEVDFEALNELKPELIIISGRLAKFYEKLSDIAPTIFVGTNNADFYNSFENKTLSLAKLYSKEDEARKHLDSLKEQIESKKALVDKDKKALVILTNAKNISVFGPASRFGMIHEIFGLSPADENLKISLHGNRADSEYILKVDPDYLFVVDRNVIVKSQDRAQAALDNALIAKTKAFKNDKIIYLDPEVWYLAGGSGLISFKMMSDEIFNSL